MCHVHVHVCGRFLWEKEGAQQGVRVFCAIYNNRYGHLCGSVIGERTSMCSTCCPMRLRCAALRVMEWNGTSSFASSPAPLCLYTFQVGNACDDAQYEYAERVVLCLTFFFNFLGVSFDTSDEI